MVRFFPYSIGIHGIKLEFYFQSQRKRDFKFIDAQKQNASQASLLIRKRLIIGAINQRFIYLSFLFRPFRKF